MTWLTDRLLGIGALGLFAVLSPALGMRAMNQANIFPDEVTAAEIYLRAVSMLAGHPDLIDSEASILLDTDAHPMKLAAAASITARRVKPVTCVARKEQGTVRVVCDSPLSVEWAEEFTYAAEAERTFVSNAARGILPSIMPQSTVGVNVGNARLRVSLATLEHVCVSYDLSRLAISATEASSDLVDQGVVVVFWIRPPSGTTLEIKKAAAP
jgi:hypothetical protein